MTRNPFLNPACDHFHCDRCDTELLGCTDMEFHNGEYLCHPCLKEVTDEEQALELEAELHAPKYDLR